MFREDETKVLQKNLQEEKFAGKRGTVSLSHQPLPSSLVGASLKPISNGRWGKSPQEDPSRPSSIYTLSIMSWGFAQWFIWETWGILTWSKAVQGALSPLPGICCTVSGNSLNISALQVFFFFFLVDFLVGHLLNNICINYLRCFPFSWLFNCYDTEARFDFIFLPLVWMFLREAKFSSTLSLGTNPATGRGCRPAGSDLPPPWLYRQDSFPSFDTPVCFSFWIQTLGHQPQLNYRQFSRVIQPKFPFLVVISIPLPPFPFSLLCSPAPVHSSPTLPYQQGATAR